MMNTSSISPPLMRVKRYWRCHVDFSDRWDLGQTSDRQESRSLTSLYCLRRGKLKASGTRIVIMSSKLPDDETTASERSGGSNHSNIGVAMTGAMQKALSSPLGGRLRKVVRKTNSGAHFDDANETPSKQDKNPSDHSSDGSSKDDLHSPSPAAGKKKSFDSKDTKLFGSAEKASETLLVNPVKEVAHFFGEAGKGVKHLVVRNKGSSSNLPQDDEDQQDSDLPAVPPDDTLQKMNVIINKCLKGVSIPSYYETAWSEDSGDENEPLYRSFLEESGKEDIVIEDWKVAETGNGFVGEWDGEKYTQKRVRCCPPPPPPPQFIAK